MEDDIIKKSLEYNKHYTILSNIYDRVSVTSNLRIHLLLVNDGFDVIDLEQSTLRNLELISDQIQMSSNLTDEKKAVIYDNYVLWKEREFPIWEKYKEFHPFYTVFISVELQKVLSNKVCIFSDIIQSDGMLYYLLIEYIDLHENEKKFIESIFNQYCKRLEEFYPHDDAIIYNAGRDVITNVDIKLKDKDKRSGLYDNIEIISSLTYEKDQSIGIVYFLKSDDINQHINQLDIKFTTPHDINEHRIIRKLLQLVSTGYCLIATVHKVYGIMNEDNAKALMSISYQVHFKKGRVWELSHNGNQIITSHYSRFQFVYKQVNYHAFDAQMKKLGCSETRLDFLHTLLNYAKNQDKGTTIVFSKDAESEAMRLEKTSFPIDPINLCDENRINIISHITSIDGALLCDISGYCYAIGVILDGNTQNEASKETVAKGARHNSAYRYYQTYKNCVIVIVSEDKDITIVPQS